MFSEHPFNSMALVLAIVAYVGAVRLAIQQRLGQELRKMDRLKEAKEAKEAETDATRARDSANNAIASAEQTLEAASEALEAARKAIKAEHEDWDSAFCHARGHARAILLLMPADIIFISVAIILIFTEFPGSRESAINWGIMAGAGWLAFLHFLQWCKGRKATKIRRRTNDGDENAEKYANKRAEKRNTLANKGYFCHWGLYSTAIIGPVALMAGFLFWPGTDPTENAEAHHKSGLKLYKRDRFEQAIAEQRHAIRICDDTACDKMARYHYALAKALASKSDEYAPLAALRLAIGNDCELREKAKREAAFDSIRCDAPLHELVGDASRADASGSATEAGGRSAEGG